MKMRIILAVLLCHTFGFAQLKTIKPGTNEGPATNPLKGWNSGWNSDAPLSTIGFQYISWSRLEPKDDQFDWEEVERVLNRRGSKGKHLVIRFYADWNHRRIDAPDWLYKKGVKLRRRGESMATDYDSPVFIAEAVEAINALAKRYDNDPRLAFVEIGTIGFWGEWHNHPIPEWRPSSKTKTIIRDTYLKAFKNAKLLGRYPTESVLNSTGKIGFHNDNFKPSAGSSFDDTIEKNNYHLQGPIGGEQGGGIPKKEFDQMFLTGKGLDMVKTGRYTFMKASTRDYGNTANWKKMDKLMGYNYEINTIRYSDKTKGEVTVEIDGRNKGVAPAYFWWPVQVAVLDNNGKELHRETLKDDIRTWLPGKGFKIRATFDAANVSRGNHQLAIRIIQPRADLNKGKAWGLDARNVYMEFSNNLKVTKANWGSQNQLQGGWTIMGGITFDNNVTPTPTPSGNQKPTVSFGSPKSNITIQEGTNIGKIEVTAKDSDGVIRNVRLYLNGKFIRQENKFPYTWNEKTQNDTALKSLRTGTYIVKAIATDDKGASSETTIRITVTKKNIPTEGSLDIVSGGVYHIIAKHSGQYVEISNGVKSNGGNIQQWTANGKNWQKWILTSVGNGYYTIKSLHSGLYMDVDSASRNKGANIKTYGTSSNMAHRQFKLINRGNGYYAIQARHSGYCLDVENASKANGANIEQWACSGEDHKLFRLVHTNQGQKVEDDLIQFSMFPNPADDQVTVQYAPQQGPGQIQLYSISGQLIRSYNTSNSGQETIDVSELAQGIYLIKINTPGTIQTEMLRIE